MIGVVLSFDRETGRGLIKSQGGAGDFSFVDADLRCSSAKVREGVVVSFLPVTVDHGHAVAAMIELEPEDLSAPS